MTISKSVVKRLKAQSTAPAFRDQAAAWVQQGSTRKRSPLRPASVKTYLSQIETNLNPLIGEFPLDTVGNMVVKDVVAKLAERGLKPSVIDLNINIIKQIRASAINQEGEQLYPYTWNADVIDAPVLDKKAQKTPIASAQAVQDAISKAGWSEKALYALLAGSGLRISEALALHAGPDNETSSFWIPADSKVVIREQRVGDHFGPVKTKAGVREIDLPRTLNEFLKTTLPLAAQNVNVPYVLFPQSESFFRQGMVRYGLKGGFHSLRRFRVTHLRMQGVPDALIHFWVGHEDESVTDRYTKVGGEIEARKAHAEKAGLGFEL